MTTMTDAEHGADAAAEPRLIDHLIELRARLLRAVCGLMLVFVALLPFANKIYAWLAQPLLAKLPTGGQLIARTAKVYFKSKPVTGNCAPWDPPG